MSGHPAVAKAYRDGEYTDANGTLWQRGLDGWFDRSDPDLIRLAYHHSIVELIEIENPS